MYCNYCGKQIDNKSVFCNFCGQKIPTTTIIDKNINNLSSKIYEEFLIKNELLYNFIVNDNLLEIDNLMIFTLISFTFHIYFFRILLLPKYPDEEIQKVFVICLNKVIASISSNLKEKEQIIDHVYKIFYSLDILMLEIQNAKNKERSILAMQEIAKLFIELVQTDENSNAYNCIAVQKITTYFTLLLTDNDLLVRIEK